MRKLTIENKGVEISVNNWDIDVNQQNIGRLIQQQLKPGKFIGNIKIVIEQTETDIDEEHEMSEE